jgi:hypothetical protein
MSQASITAALGDGNSIKFWLDHWLDQGAIYCFAPNLFRAVGRSRRNIDHLLAGCVFSREVWYKTLSRMGLEQQASKPTTTLLKWWMQARGTVLKTFWRGVRLLCPPVSWNLWKERN